MKKIVVNLDDPGSIASAHDYFEKYAKTLKYVKFLSRITSELGQIGAEVIDGAYSGGDEYDQGEYTIRCQKIAGGGCLLIAEGQNVMFLEFGTGVMTDVEYGSDEVGLFVYPGSWSQSEGVGQFVPGKHEYWFYDRKFYRGTPATKGFYFASKVMKDKAVGIVKKAVAEL